MLIVALGVCNFPKVQCGSCTKLLSCQSIYNKSDVYYSFLVLLVLIIVFEDLWNSCFSSSFAHPHVDPNLYEFLSSAEQ